MWEKEQGISILELTLIVIFISILMSFALNLLLKLRVDGERTSVEQIIVDLQSAIRIEISARSIRGGFQQFINDPCINPMTLLAKVPKNYVGEFQYTTPSQIKPGKWYFDRDECILVYRVFYTENFHTTLQGVPRIRYKVIANYDTSNTLGRARQAEDLNLLGLDGYYWQK